jgi:hypothetical protein
LTSAAAFASASASVIFFFPFFFDFCKFCPVLLFSFAGYYAMEQLLLNGGVGEFDF